MPKTPPTAETPAQTIKRLQREQRPADCKMVLEPVGEMAMNMRRLGRALA